MLYNKASLSVVFSVAEPLGSLGTMRLSDLFVFKVLEQPNRLCVRRLPQQL